MGILNLTPDSFYDGGKLRKIADVLFKADEMYRAGADILDLGAVSTRPGAEPVSPEVEKQRLIPAVEAIMKRFPEAILSIDTFRSKIARDAIAAGASMINDISGGTLDPDMYATITELQVPYVVMHMQGTPATMQQNPSYGNVTKEVIRWIADRLSTLRQAGVNDLIADPGFGFGKTTEHNYTLLNELDYFQILGVPLLIGLSRKSMIYKPLQIKPEESLAGTIALHYHALMHGADILRVHDVKEAVETIRVFELAGGLNRRNPLLHI
ncbi:MAG TPA: dihydropteroate synthase [Bacteroidales bacterium]|nr:dihydropteroate synthase [Bacteroidales bacterium]HRZ47814.1 dihydropteroate synthase [Bacteroidales bacterium]